MGRLARTLPTTVSNPVLAGLYGGPLIPHVRDSGPQGRPHVREAPVIAFVGSVKPHKGIDLLRGAVAQLSRYGYRLVITGEAPNDARPWEDWVGVTSFEDGLQLVGDADIVALPSLYSPWARGQLPAKLIDAMLLERAVVVSDVGPLRWAVDDTGLVVRPGHAADLVCALHELRSPERRADLGRRARRLAELRFTVDAVAPRFAEFCLDVIDLHASDRTAT
ncbi:glycosyltransferase family 4 protein [Georgenia muralis]